MADLLAVVTTGEEGLMELRQAIARIVAEAAGVDLDGFIPDVYFPDDPDCIYPWAPYRESADAILAIPEIKEALEIRSDDLYDAFRGGEDCGPR